MYDIIFLAAFVTLLGIFLYRKRKNLKKEGLLLLYKTNLGVKLIHKVGEKYQRTLKFLSYISVILGYFLMAGMLYLTGRILWIYAFHGEVVRAIKIPPIMPIVPYLPQVFKLTFLPPFYFTYWIIIIAIIAITHEFAHGIFAVRNKIKIKNTGFGFFPFFLPIFLAAFVELDEKKMAKKKTFDQLTVLSAGTFANTLTAIFFFIVMIIFFAFVFAPSGVAFDAYPYTTVSIPSITMINGVPLANSSYQEVLSLMNNTGFNKVQTSDGNFLATKNSIKKQKIPPNQLLIMYYDSPAVKANLESIILDINGDKINSVNGLAEELHKYAPGDVVTLTVMGKDNKPYNRDITLGQNPKNKSQSWLGVGFSHTQKRGFLSQFYNALSSFKRNDVYYASKIGGIGIFIYNLLWWLVIISISVALVNMLPMGIFDGGRFFYLTIFAITKNKKFSEKAFKFMTYFFLLLLLVVMFLWVFQMR